MFDSAPGPLGLQNVQKYLGLDRIDTGIEKWKPCGQSAAFLLFHLFGVDMANRVPLRIALSNVARQIR